MITDKDKQHVEKSIIENSNEFAWGLREWSISTIIDKFTKNSKGEDIDGYGDFASDCELYIPDYQREYKWSDEIASRFIESILLGFPIPYLYIATINDPDDQEQDGRIEIIDGSQRIRALLYFIKNDFKLINLKEIKGLEGFTFDDLLPGRQRKFLRESLRLIELKNDNSGDYRRNLFERINSGVVTLEPMEKRKGGLDAKSSFFTDVLTPCSENEIFKELAPLSEIQMKKQDSLELVLRFFAYSDNLPNYKGEVKPFLDEYLKAKSENGSFDKNDYCQQFIKTMEFIKKNFPYGFRKSRGAKSISRAYFEAIAIGSNLALIKNPNLKPNNAEWINSEEFKKIVTSDAANNKTKLFGRINFVKDKLLEIS